MANSRPKPHPANLHSWKPGQSGNPAGYSRKRRIADAMVRFVDAKKNRANELAAVVFAMATGRRDLLPTSGEPDLAWFRELRSILGEDQPGASGTRADAAGEDITTLRDYLARIHIPGASDEGD